MELKLTSSHMSNRKILEKNLDSLVQRANDIIASCLSLAIQWQEYHGVIIRYPHFKHIFSSCNSTRQRNVHCTNVNECTRVLQVTRASDHFIDTVVSRMFYFIDTVLSRMFTLSIPCFHVCFTLSIQCFHVCCTLIRLCLYVYLKITPVEFSLIWINL